MSSASQPLSPKQIANFRLEDPMRGVKRIFERWTIRFLVVFLISLLLPLSLLVLGEPAGNAELLFILAALVPFGTFLLLLGTLGYTAYWRAFAPHRETDIFYLRSFRNDASTWRIRVAIQDAIGSRLRLSGIRDPQRRDFSLTQLYSPIFAAMKYCTPRYMDLEAGNDWKARLWYSLQGDRIAVIDLTDPTPFVKEEIRLAADAIGPTRLICLGDSSQTEQEVRNVVAEQVGAAAANAVNVVFWPGKTSDPQPPAKAGVLQFKRQFRELVTRVRDTSPAPAVRSVPAWCGDVGKPANRADQMFNRLIGIQFGLIVVQILASVVIHSAARDAGESRLLEAVILGPFTIGNLWLLVQNWIIYIYEVGVPRDRVKASVALSFVLAPLLLVLAPLVFLLVAPESPADAAGAAIDLTNDPMILKWEDDQRGETH